MNTREAQRKIGEALRSVAVIDPHCHLDAARPSASTLADIVLYHHVWVELVSAGMGQHEVTRAGLPHEMTDPQMEPMERVRRALVYLPRIRNTTVGVLLRWLLGDLYGVKGGLETADLEGLAAEVEQRGRDASWPERFFSDVCHIERAVTVEPVGEKRFGRLASADERLRMLNIADGKSNPRERLEQMAGVLGRDVKTASDYREFAAKLAVDPSRGSPLFIGAWMPAFLTDELAEEGAVTRIIGKAWNGEPLSHAELGSVSFYGMKFALEELRKTPIRVIQLIVGAEVIPPHRSVTHWSGRFCGAVARLASCFEDFRFNLGAASDMYTQDIAILAKHIPNVSVGGYWWHTLYPFYIRKSIETRLDIVPAGKVHRVFLRRLPLRVVLAEAEAGQTDHGRGPCRACREGLVRSGHRPVHHPHRLPRRAEGDLRPLRPRPPWRPRLSASAPSAMPGRCARARFPTGRSPWQPRSRRPGPASRRRGSRRSSCRER